MDKYTHHSRLGPRSIRMTRDRRGGARLGLRVIASVGAALLVAGSLAEASAPSGDRERGQKRPNVLIIMTDDQRNNLRAMPMTQKLLQDKGRRFINAFASTPNCCPSRTSLFSGRYSHNHGVQNNQLAHMLDHATTLQRYLHDDGYRTALFGKFLNAWKAHNDPPYFDRWAIYKHASGVYYDGKYSVNGSIKRIRQYATDYLSNKAVDFIKSSEKSDSDPWLMYVTPNAPHEPAEPENSYKGADVGVWPGNPAVFEEDLSDKPPYVRNKKISRAEVIAFRNRQLRSVMSVDDMVERLFKTLRKLDENRETIVIFTSDNGYFWGEHGLRGKWLPYEQSVHIPLIIRWPEHIAEDTEDDRLVVNVDIAPTILDAVGIEPNPDLPMDGKSLLDTSWDRSKILLEYGSRGPRENRMEVPTWKGLRTETAAYTEYYDEFGVVDFREYYDLIQDPYELENLLEDDDLSNDGPAEVLQAELTTVKNCKGSACP